MMRSNAFVAGVFALAASMAGMQDASTHDERRFAHAPADEPRAGYAFPLAAPGSYRLPAIKPAAGGRVLDEDGNERDLADVLRGRISVLAFIYTRCGDICPTASLRLAMLQARAEEEPKIASRLRLVSMSFDPVRDTPEVMAEYALNWRSGDANAPEWLFLTATNNESLEPVLTAYNQSVIPKADTSPAGPLHHILRVFLVDESGDIRNIYSLDFLDPQLVLNDVRTLIIQSEKE